MSQALEALKIRARKFPREPGVYLIKNVGGKVIYVGKAKELRKRVQGYFSKVDIKTQYLVHQIHDIDYIVTHTEVEAFLLEASLIKKYRPRYNIRLKDDKSYPYVRCSMEVDFPRLYLSRKVNNDDSVYFGPYTSGMGVRDMICFLNHVYKLRDCSDLFMKSAKRPCITYQMGNCRAPCVDYVTRQEYQRDVQLALEFLEGKDQKVLSSLRDRMKELAKEERFEAAAKLRNSISFMEKMWNKQSVINSHVNINQDVVVYYGDRRGTLIETLHVRQGRVIGNRSYFFPHWDYQSENSRDWMTSFVNQYYSDNIIPDEIILSLDLGDTIYQLLKKVFKQRQKKESQFVHVHNEEHRKLVQLAQRNAMIHFKDQVCRQENRQKALEEIQNRFKLPAFPRRIECFDVSHFQGDETVASQVVFIDGVPQKSDYRRYKLETVGVDDYASMKEVLERRLHHTEYDLPQLILVDGGRGQLNVSCRVLKEMGQGEIPVVGMAKGKAQKEERFFLPNRKNPVIFASSEALQILIQVRDEAHRFAIVYHRMRRERKLLSSELDKVQGLGRSKKQRLLQFFSSIQRVKQANVDEICQVEGFSKKLAQRVLNQLNEIY